jgi:hypothetical protein|nr:MAG TPA: hypothetical protein [Caudoviricetes sp.]
MSVCNVCDYNLNLDEETNGISEFVLPNLNNIKKGCYLVLNGLYKQFLFVVDEDIAINKNETCVTVPALDISNIFDRKVILKDKEKMQETGIEDFIADTILENFVNTDDTILNLDYIDVYIHSHTKGSVAIDEDNGLYNFHTFLINCRQYKDVYTDFSIVNKRLKIDIGYKLEETMLIDATLPEVTNYNKIYEVDPVTKVEAYIRADSSTYCLYLTADRTTTTNKDDPNRIFGRIETISCDTLENAKEEALNTIKANTYKHLVEFSIAKTSKLIDVSKLYLGRRIKIKTEDSIYDSYISAITITDENFISFKTGNLRIDFTDKQRQQKRDGTVGNKIDKTGGTITGDLTVTGKIFSTDGEASVEKILYENQSGTQGTVTLFESANNFSSMEIFFKTRYGDFDSVNVMLKSNQWRANLSNFRVFPRSGTVVGMSRAVWISGNTIYSESLTTLHDGFGEWWSYDNRIDGGNKNSIYITKVIGYR